MPGPAAHGPETCGHAGHGHPDRDHAHKAHGRSPAQPTIRPIGVSALASAAGVRLGRVSLAAAALWLAVAWALWT